MVHLRVDPKRDLAAVGVVGRLAAGDTEGEIVINAGAERLFDLRERGALEGDDITQASHPADEVELRRNDGAIHRTAVPVLVADSLAAAGHNMDWSPLAGQLARAYAAGQTFVRQKAHFGGRARAQAAVG